MAQSDEVVAILGQAKKLAQNYRNLTGKPLGITGEVAEYEAARILGVELTAARQAGFDAVEHVNGTTRRLQIKGRCLLEDSKPGQRLGSIRIEREWDAVLMVLLDQNFDASEIYEADRLAVVEALTAPGSRARNERGAMAVGKFKSIGRLRWRRHGEDLTGSSLRSVTGPDCSTSRFGIDVDEPLGTPGEETMATKTHAWTETDDVAALYLYKYGRLPNAPSIEDVSRQRGMSSASLRMRIGNFKAIDSGSGLQHSAAQSSAVHKQFGALSEPALRALAFPADKRA